MFLAHQSYYIDSFSLQGNIFIGPQFSQQYYTMNTTVYVQVIQSLHMTKKICDRILENHPYGRKWHSKYLALKSSIQQIINT